LLKRIDREFNSARQCARRVNEIIAAMTHIGTIRKCATEICIGLQDLNARKLDSYVASGS
jgi:hypothetical protein